MAAIKYASLLDCVVSTEGSDGYMTNYFYYNVLVVYQDGSRDLITGQKSQIAYLLPFMRTPMDDITEIRDTVSGLREDINDIINQKMKHVIDSLFPIPEILGKNEVEAIDQIKEDGLIPVLEVTYPESTPKKGYVQAYGRNADNFKKVNLRIVHRVPSVNAMKIEKAIEKLKEAGFNANITHKVVSGTPDGIVLNCSRQYDTSLLVDLEVSSSIPETKGMTIEEATQLLKNEGYDVTVIKQVNEMAPGKVIKWESIGAKKIKLFQSIPAVYDSKYVDVKWSTMQDSSSDTYGAIAKFDNNRQELTIKVSYTVGSKAKHQVNGISLNKDIGSQSPQVDTSIMEPNTKGSMKIIVPFGKVFEELPANLSFTLDTQYGLMKKKDPVTLQFALNW